MDTQKAYDEWSSTYDSVINKTRDLELIAAKDVLVIADFKNVLEIGCGTGKNTSWLAERSGILVSVDFSEGMLNIAREKIKAANVTFRQADLTKPWNSGNVSLIVCSLVLEHIENLGHIFEQAARALDTGGCFYICELHPYKQLEGSRAKFEKGDQLVQLEYFVHHISDFFHAAKRHGLQCIDLKEWFDPDSNRNDRSATPRLVSFLFQKL